MKHNILYFLAGALMLSCVAATDNNPKLGEVRWHEEQLQAFIHEYTYPSGYKGEKEKPTWVNIKWPLKKSLEISLINNSLVCEVNGGHKWKYRSHSSMFGEKGPIYYFECSVCKNEKGFFEHELSPKQIEALKELGCYVEIKK